MARPPRCRSTALGAALCGLISVGAWDDFFASRARTNCQVDVTRVAPYVAAGIGFIGAGVIFHDRRQVRGLTTAASIWTVAAIGVMAGLGMIWVALYTTVATWVALRWLKRLAPPRAAKRPNPDGGTGPDGGPDPCPGPTTDCGGTCVDTDGDELHCGSCDNARKVL